MSVRKSRKHSSYRSSYLPAYLELTDSDVGRTRRISTEYYRRHLVMTACSKVQKSDAICWHCERAAPQVVLALLIGRLRSASATSETTLRSVFDWTRSCWAYHEIAIAILISNTGPIRGYRHLLLAGCWAYRTRSSVFPTGIPGPVRGYRHRLLA